MQTDYERMIDSAYQLGYEARQTKRLSENPFHPGSQADEYDAWKDGWKDRCVYERQEWPAGRDRDEWKHEAAQAMRLKR